MDRIKVLPNERVDLEDFRAAVGDLVFAELMRQACQLWLPTGRTTGLALTSARVLGGFTETHTVGASCLITLTRGSGLFPVYEDGQVTYGLLLGTEDPATSVIDLSGVPNDDYLIYVRAMITDATYENRVFWNPSGAPAAEEIDHMATRRVQGWETTFAAHDAAPPGHGEWVPLWKATRAGGVLTVVADYRHFLFEGSVPDTYAEEWGGGANDRNANRALYGVQDLHMFAQLVRRQLANIIGVKHYTAIPRHLTDLAVQHLAGGDHGAVYAGTVGISADGVDTGWQSYLRAKYGATNVIHRGTKIHGHLVRPHEFFDDFFYCGDATNYLHTQIANLPWGFRAVAGGILGGANNYAYTQADKGGVLRLHAENVANRGIDMISGYNASTATFKGWWDLLSPLCAAMFRFKTPADISEHEFVLGLVVAGDFSAQPAAVAIQVGGVLTAYVRGLGVGVGVPIGNLVASTWYTLRMWTKSGTTVSFQLNNAAAVDASTAGADTIQSGAYDLFVRNVVSAAPAAARDLYIDQAFACDGELAADME